MPDTASSSPSAPEPAVPGRMDGPRHVAGTGTWEATLSLEEIGALCDRLGLPGPGGLRGSAPPDVLDGMVERGLVRLVEGQLVVGEEAAAALELLAAPALSISVLRQGSRSVTTGFIGLATGRAAELRPLGEGWYLLALFPAATALARAIASCELVHRPVSEVGSLRITPARLVAVGDLVAAGDVTGAAALLAACDATEEVQAAFLRALVSRLAGCQVTVIDRADPTQLRGTVTTWLDGGSAGLWRIPPTDLYSRHGDGGTDEHVLREMDLDVRAVAMAELVAEMTEGFPGLTPA